MKIAIIDDDRAIRKVLRKIIESHNIGNIVFENDNGSYVNHIDFDHDQVDVILTDVIMPVKNGIEAIKDLKQLNYNGVVVVLSQVTQKDFIGEAYALGVEYYINKPINLIEVVSVFEKVKEKLELQEVEKKYRINEIKSQLTPTELKILKLINQRLTQAEIASELCVTLQTVKNHITKIIRKTKSRNSKEAAIKVYEMEIFS